MNIIIPTAFRKHTSGAKEVPSTADTVGQAIEQLVVEYPALREYLYCQTGEIASFVGVFVNDQNIRDLDGDRTVVTERDEILLVPAIAGG
ncbi:MoaD/ThiS family protein [Roseiconus lacunae]|uniref:MoaD/ThiS family protein n=1 Tax=Roseiconus lacunae TaxID=2605694 RepID=UPI0011F1A35C|nr:MoaD/ThiS family protein [Roseiconus lacunae]